MAVTISTPLKTASRALHFADRMIWLVELVRTASVTNRYALGQLASVSFNGFTWSPIAGSVQDIAQESGAMMEIAVAMSNVDRLLQTYVEAGEILNRRSTLRLVSSAALDSGSHALSIPYYVTDAVFTDENVVFVFSFWDLGIQSFPRDRFMRTRCRWVFKEAATCAYTGGLTTCDKSYTPSSGCSGRLNQARFGGFPFLLSGPSPMLP